MLLHCVFCAIRTDADPKEVRSVMADLASLKPEVDGFLDFRHGPNRDYEKKSLRHGLGFVIAFRDREALRSYDEHPRHRDAGARLVALCEGGHDGVVVYDIEASEP
jgi:hypothetical protein